MAAKEVVDDEVVDDEVVDDDVVSALAAELGSRLLLEDNIDPRKSSNKSQDSNVGKKKPIRSPHGKGQKKGTEGLPMAAPKGNSFPTTVLIFDLETTGLIRKSQMPHITQFAVVEYGGRSTFNKYVIPKVSINKQAEGITGIRVFPSSSGNLVMTVKGNPVEAISMQETIKQFIDWIGSSGWRECSLVAHNGKRFDFPVLASALANTGLKEKFEGKVVAYVDSLEVLRKKLPGRKSYKQETLISDVLNEPYNAHNALDDVKALSELLKAVGVNIDDFQSHSFSANV